MNSGFNSIKKNTDFRRVYKYGKIKSNKYFTLTYLKNSEISESAIGISISRKVGKSVVRNKIKRRMREIIRKNYSCILAGYELVFVVRKPCCDLDFLGLEEAFIKTLKMAKLVSNNDF